MLSSLSKYPIMSSVWLALITGLTTGGISCLAVQGGLLASSVSNLEKDVAAKKKSLYVGSFLAAKLIVYTLLGFGLGFLGSSLILTPKLLGFMQILAGAFMVVTALRLLDIHPVFRRLVIEPPKWAFRLARNQSKSDSYFAPTTLGFLTVLIPCGVTQAMMALAVATANPVYGAAIMFAFTIGTSPVFFAVGMAATEMLKRKKLVYAASSAIFVLGILSLNTGQVLRGSPHTLQNYWFAVVEGFGNQDPTKNVVAGVNAQGQQEVTINVADTTYNASTTTLKAGVPVKLTVNTNNTRGCIRAFTIPSLNFYQVLPETGTEVIEFTPESPGRLAYTCSMGMYSGFFDVIP